MKTFLILATALLIKLNSFGQADSAYSLDPIEKGFTDKAEAKNLTINGKKEGKWIEYFGAEKNMCIRTNKRHACAYTLAIYKADFPVWTRQYYMDGHLMTESYHIPGHGDCILRFYYESGMLLRELPTNAKDTAKWYYENGKLKGISFPVIDGKSLGYDYDLRGNLIQTDTMRGRNESGIIRIYYPSGKLHYECPYVNDPTNKKGKISFDSNTFQCYQSKKFRKFQHNISGYIKNGSMKSYYDGGALEWEAPYLDGHLNGTWKYYYAGGELRSETPFVNGKANGVSKDYYKNGKLMSETTYTDGKASATKKYDENGQEIK